MQKQLLPIALLAIIAAGAAFFLLMEKPVVESSPSVLFDDFADNSDKLLSIKVSDANGQVLTVTKDETTWSASLTALNIAYPVNEAKLKALVEAMAAANLREKKTAKEAYFERLGLRALDTPDSQARLVEFSNGKKVWELLVGNQASSGVGHFVRLPTESQSWLLDTVIPLPTDGKSWLKESILDFGNEQIFAVQRVGQQAWSIARQEGSDEVYVLENFPAGRELKYQGVVEGIVTNMTSMTFDDVLAQDALELNEEQLTTELIITRSEADPVSLKLYEVGNDYYVSLSTSSELDKAYWENVIYKVSSFVAGQLNKLPEDFLQEEASDEEIMSEAIDEGEAPGD